MPNSPERQIQLFVNMGQFKMKRIFKFCKPKSVFTVFCKFV